MTGNRVAYRAFHEVESQFPEISHADFEASVQLIEPNGRILSGADAVFRTLEFSRIKRLLLWLRRVPGFMLAARLAYNFIARHRSFLGRFS